MVKDQDCEALHPNLVWVPIDHIKHTLATTTQWLHNAYCIPFHKHLNPACQLQMVPVVLNPSLLTLCSLMNLP